MHRSFIARSTKVLLAATALGMLVAAGPGDAGPNGPDQGSAGQRQNHQQNQSKTLTGSVSGYNLTANGVPESMMLKTADSTVQLNFSADMANAVQTAAAVGSQVTVVASTGGTGPMGFGGRRGPDDQQQSDHKVMNLESIKTATGSLTVAAAAGQEGQEQGTVKQLNYNRWGDVNGALLDNGVFVYLRFGTTADLTVGEKVTVKGREHTANSGTKIIQAESINGADVEDNGPEGMGPPGGPGGNGGPGNGPPGNVGGPPGQ